MYMYKPYIPNVQCVCVLYPYTHPDILTHTHFPIPWLTTAKRCSIWCGLGLSDHTGINTNIHTHVYAHIVCTRRHISWLTTAKYCAHSFNLVRAHRQIYQHRYTYACTGRHISWLTITRCCARSFNLMRACLAWSGGTLRGVLTFVA